MVRSFDPPLSLSPRPIYELKRLLPFVGPPALSIVFKNCSTSGKHASTIDFHYHHRKLNALLNKSPPWASKLHAAYRCFPNGRSDDAKEKDRADLTRNRSPSFMFLLRARDKNYQCQGNSSRIVAWCQQWSRYGRVGGKWGGVERK